MVEVKNEHSSAWDNRDTPKLVLEAGPSAEQQRQEPASPSSSPTRAITDPDDGTATGSLQALGDEASSDSDFSRENVAGFNLDTASGGCITCSDADKVSIQTVHKKYQRRVRALL